MSRSRIRWLIVGALLVALVVAGLSRISFNIDILKLLPGHLSQVQGLTLFLKNFAQPNELVVTIEAENAEAAEQAATSLAEHLRKRTDRIQSVVDSPPWEKNPAGLSEMLAFLLLNQPPDQIAALVARLAPGQEAATLRRTMEKLTESISPQEVAMSGYDPYDLGGPLMASGLFSGAQQSEFSSADGTFRVIYVEALHPFGNYKKAISWLHAIQKEADAWRGNQKIQLGFTGEPAFVADISGSTEWDMMSSGFATLIVIATIFWLCYRRARPLMELQAMLVLIFTVSLAIAGLFLDQLTVIGVGCAAIMIGLSVDYGYFIFQRSQQHRGTVAELQRQCLQNIMWTAGTTAAAFFALNLSSLPGLSQLGNLVGIGVLVGAAVMLGIFAPITARFHRLQGTRPASVLEGMFAAPRFLAGGAWLTAVLILALLGVLMVKGWPSLDFTSRSLRPRASGANDAMDHLYSRLTDDRDMLSLVVAGGDEAETLDRLRGVEQRLQSAKERGEVRSFRSALAVWPDPKRQRENLPLLSGLAAQSPRLEQQMEAAGFQKDAFVLTDAVLRQWGSWAGAIPPIWPTDASSRWIFRRLASRQSGRVLAMGMVQPVAGKEETLAAAVEGPGVYLVSWNRLGTELKRVIPREFANVIAALVGSVLLLLAFAFRSARALLLFVATTALVLVCLAGAMSLFGMSWNFFNMAAVLLLLGTGTDYSILLLLALRRNGGDGPAAQKELGLVISLCASSAAAGFGTISWANNLGLASLGQTCALGLVIDALISLFLLPRAWKFIHRNRPAVS